MKILQSLLLAGSFLASAQAHASNEDLELAKLREEFEVSIRSIPYSDRRTALHFALGAFKYWSVAELHLEKNVPDDFETPDNSGLTPLSTLLLTGYRRCQLKPSEQQTVIDRTKRLLLLFAERKVSLQVDLVALNRFLWNIGINDFLNSTFFQEINQYILEMQTAEPIQTHNSTQAPLNNSSSSNSFSQVFIGSPIRFDYALLDEIDKNNPPEM